jgi:hypothetical protein
MGKYPIALIAWLALLLASCGAPAARLGPTRAGSADPAANIAAAERAKGDPSAPVTLIEYGDYQ